MSHCLFALVLPGFDRSSYEQGAERDGLVCGCHPSSYQLLGERQGRGNRAAGSKSFPTCSIYLTVPFQNAKIAVKSKICELVTNLSGRAQIKATW